MILSSLFTANIIAFIRAVVNMHKFKILITCATLALIVLGGYHTYQTYVRSNMQLTQHTSQKNAKHQGLLKTTPQSNRARRIEHQHYLRAKSILKHYPDAVRPRHGVYYVHCSDSNSPKFNRSVKQATKVWNNSTNAKFKLTNSDNANIVVQEIHGRPSALGEDTTGEERATYYTGEGVDTTPTFGSIKINSGFINRIHSDCSTVIVHELGHAIGLGHNSNKRSIMYRNDTGNNRKQRLLKSDKQQVNQIVWAWKYCHTNPKPNKY